MILRVGWVISFVFLFSFTREAAFIRRVDRPGGLKTALLMFAGDPDYWLG